jgi:UDP-3-O-[3-hydroxymyristoyl] N-acetylglucosamine deacetylase
VKQRTINKEVSIEGIGVHLGQSSRITLKSAEINSGIIFFNPKFPKEKIVLGKIIPEQAIHASVLKGERLVISTIEHLMACVAAFQIDNLLIEIDGIEVPILDGSAISFVEIIESVGIKEQDANKKFLTPRKKLVFEDEESGRFIEILPAKNDDTNFYFDYTVDFKHHLVGIGNLKDTFSLNYFKNNIAPARTFGFLEQLPFLRSQGLAKGTSLGNTVVIGEEEFLNEPRFDDEFVRHKLLDLIGDLALLGKSLAGTVNAKRTGHNFNRLVIQDYINNPDNWILI